MRIAIVALVAVAVTAAGGAAFFANRVIAEQRSATATVAPVQVAPIAQVQVLVASGDLAPGQSVGRDAMRWQPWPGDMLRSELVSIDRDDIRGSLDDAKREAEQRVLGKIARRAILGGEPLTEAAVFERGKGGFLAGALEEGHRAVSVAVTAASGASGFILPGDRVDVILSHDVTRSLPRDAETDVSSGIARHAAETVVEDVRVLAVDQALSPDKDEEAKVSKTVTLEVTRRQAEALAVVVQMGDVSLALRSLSVLAEDEDAVTSDRAAIRFVSDVAVSPALAAALQVQAPAAEAAPMMMASEEKDDQGWTVAVHRGGKAVETVSGADTGTN